MVAQYRGINSVSFEQVPYRRPYLEQAGKLFSVYGDLLLELFKRKLPEEEALDVYQTLFLKIARKGFPEDLNDVKGYLYRTAINAMNDYLRKEKTYRRKILESTNHNTFKSCANPAAEAMHRELVTKAFEEIRKSLSPSVNQVFILKYQQKLNHDEIAENMGISKGTVDRYLSVSTKLLREIPRLHDKFFGVPDE